MHTHGAESADQNRRSGPMSAYRVALHKQTARYPTNTDWYDVHEARVDTFCTVASETPIATIYTARSTGVSADQSR